MPLQPDELVVEIERLRAALIECGRDAGCFLADDVSTDFLMLVPGEVRARLKKLALASSVPEDLIQPSEREMIVRWLRAQNVGGAWLALAIERGEHLEAPQDRGASQEDGRP